MKNLKKLVIAAGAALVMTNGAQAAVLTFDDYTTDFKKTLTTYGGFTWTSTGIIEATAYNAHYEVSDSGYDNGVVSTDYVAYNQFAGIASAADGLFDFVGANFTAAWRNDLQLTVTGYLNGLLIDTRTVTLQSEGADAAQWIAFNFNGIDKLEFNSSGGTINTNFVYTGSDSTMAPSMTGSHFVMDNFTYTSPAPEPSSMVLGLMGLGSALGFRRKNAKKA